MPGLYPDREFLYLLLTMFHDIEVPYKQGKLRIIRTYGTVFSTDHYQY
jgi:hypothetical protein